MHQHHLCCIIESDSFQRYFTKYDHQLFRLFHNGFEWWRFPFTFSGMVRFQKYLIILAFTTICLIFSSVISFKLRMIFNWKSPFGYLIACCFQAVTAHYITYILASNSSFLYGSCRMLKSMAIDIKKEWNAIKELGKSEGSHVEFNKRLNEYIKFHAAAKQLSHNFRIFFLFSFFHSIFLKKNTIFSIPDWFWISPI